MSTSIFNLIGDSTFNDICDWVCENQPCERKLHRVIFFANIFCSECGIPFPSISEESPLNSAVVREILLCLYKQFVSYDRAKAEKLAIFLSSHG